MRPLLLLLPAILVLVPSGRARTMDPEQVLFRRTMEAMRQVKACSFVLDIHERIRGVVRYDEFVVKLNANPYKVYVYSVTPNPGAEALLIDGENDGKAWINANRFLIPTLSLSPYGAILRKNHQYTLWHFGFGYIHDILNGYAEKYGDRFFGLLRAEEDVVWNGKTYHQLVIENDDFAFVDYTVQPGENLVGIGNKLMVNDYMILEANRGLRNFDDVKAGDRIRVPNSFGKKIVLYIDKDTFLPMVQIVYDHKGLYGRVELTSMILNPAFTPDDFSRHNKHYGF